MVSQQWSAPELPSADMARACNGKICQPKKPREKRPGDFDITGCMMSDDVRFTAVLRVRPHDKEQGDAAQLDYHRRDEADHQSDLRRSQCHSNNATKP